MCPTDKIRNNIDKGQLTGIVFMDLHKAFNTVNHDMLFDKLRTIHSFIGFNEYCASVLSSYLSNRDHRIDMVIILNVTILHEVFPKDRFK